MNQSTKISQFAAFEIYSGKMEWVIKELLTIKYHQIIIIFNI
jgi:hypothetical protein